MKRPLRRWVGLLGLGVAVLWFFYPVVTDQGVLFYRDLSLHHYPVRSYTTPLLRSGVLPLWNPFLSAGMPLLANPNNLILHPITLLYLVLPLGVAFPLSIISQVLLAGLGMILWCRERGLGEEASVAGGLAYTFSGGIASCGNLLNLLSSWAWAPLALFAWSRYQRTRSHAAIVGFIGSLSVPFFAGDAIAVLTVMVLCALQPAPVGPESGGFSARRRFSALSAAALLAAGLALVQILPLIEMVSHSYRAGGIPFADAVGWSLPPSRLLEFVVPALYGDLTAIRPETNWGATVFPAGQFLLSVYLGPVVFFLAGFALKRKGDRQVVVLWALSLLAIAVALGEAGGIYPFLHRHVPLVASLRYPSRFLLPAFLVLSFLAAVGFREFVRAPEPRGEARFPWVAGGVAVLLAGLAFVVLLSPARLEGFITGILRVPESLGRETLMKIAGHLQWSILRCLLLCILLATLCVLRRRGRWPAGLLSTVLAAGIGVDLITANAWTNPVCAPGIYETKPPVLDLLPEEARDRQRIYPGDKPSSLIVWAQTDSSAWSYYWDRLTLRLSTAMPDRLMMAYYGTVDSLSPEEMTRLAQQMRIADAVTLRRLCELASVGVMMSYSPLEDEAVVRLGVVSGRTNVPLNLYGLPNALPRATWITRARPARGSVLDDLTDPGFDPRHEVYLEGGGDSRPAEEGPAEIRWSRAEPERLQLEVSAANRGWLVLTDSHYPGWRATIDGTEVPIQRANHMFRAIEVPGGRHRILFLYLPKSLVWGAIGSGLSALAVGLLLVRGRSPWLGALFSAPGASVRNG